MNTEKKVLDELKCAVCGDVLRSDAAQQCSSVKQKALEPTRETVRRHRWRYVIAAREQKSVGCAMPVGRRSSRTAECSDRPAGSNST